MTPTDWRRVPGRIFDLQRFALFDGPGIRTNVFFKGCPLRCSWCHNPEGIDPQPQVLFTDTLCVGCGRCLLACATDGHRLDPQGRHVIDRTHCTACGACAAACPSRALELAGRAVTAGEVIDEVLKDRIFYQDSAGGMTLSGGEPLMQPDFAEALLRLARQEGLHTAVETSGFCPWSRLEAVRPFVSLFLYDIKETDPARHERLTGAALAPVLENLRRLSDAGAAIVLRLPLIPGCNDRPEHIAAVAKLAGELKGLCGADLLPYHRLGEGKRRRLGLPEPSPVAAAPEPEVVAGWIAAFAGAGLAVRTPDG